MIKSFSCQNCSFDEYIQKVSAALAGRELGKIVSVSSAGSEVKVTFTKLGKSEVTYGFKGKNDASGFECTHQSEKIAITHRALRRDIESKFADVLKTTGATVEQA